MLYTVTRMIAINYISYVFLSEYLRSGYSPGLIPGGSIVQRFIFRRDNKIARNSQGEWL